MDQESLTNTEFASITQELMIFHQYGITKIQSCIQVEYFAQISAICQNHFNRSEKFDFLWCLQCLCQFKFSIYAQRIHLNMIFSGWNITILIFLIELSVASNPIQVLQLYSHPTVMNQVV